MLPQQYRASSIFISSYPEHLFCTTQEKKQQNYLREIHVLLNNLLGVRFHASRPYHLNMETSYISDIW